MDITFVITEQQNFIASLLIAKAVFKKVLELLKVKKIKEQEELKTIMGATNDNSYSV
jgi:hypothetical protein